jgi:hypothetical protein
LPGALHRRCPGARGQVLRVPQNALAARWCSRIALQSAGGVVRMQIWAVSTDPGPQLRSLNSYTARARARSLLRLFFASLRR